MKLAAILVAISLQVSAFTSGQVTLSLKDAPLEKAFDAIKQQTGMYFFYLLEDVARAKNVTLSVKNVAVDVALEKVLDGQNLTFLIKDRNIFIKRVKRNTDLKIEKPADTASQNTDINGKISSDDGDPIAGASVIVRGSKRATMTDNEGRFVITARKGEILEISYVGMRARNIVINSKTMMVKLSRDIKNEDLVTVVSTGYQRINRERMVGAFSKIDSATYNRRAGMDIINRLDGIVTGVLFDRKGVGAPIQIRGVSTLQGNNSPSSEPLIVVDNFPYTGNINTINPNDVESITILKDAAAASIWGTRAGNGVIVITTKKGRFNQPFQVSFSSNVTVQEKPDLYYAPIMNNTDFIDVEKYLFNQGFYDANLSNNYDNPVVSPVVEILDRMRRGQVSQAEGNEQIEALKKLDLRDDLDKYVYQPAIFQQHFINFSGGSKNINYQLSLGYNRRAPNIRGSRSDNQFTISSNTTFRPTDKLELQAGINYSHAINKSYNFSLNTLYPYAQLKDQNGNAAPIPINVRLGYIDTAGGGQLLDWHFRPLDEIRLSDNASVVKMLRLNMGASYKLLDWLQAEVRYQFSNQTIDGRNYYSPETYFTRDQINSYTNLNEVVPYLRYPVPRGGILDLSNNQRTSHHLRGQFNISKSWNNENSLNILIAGEVSETKGPQYNTRLYGYDETNGFFQPSVDYLRFYPLYGKPFSLAPIPQANYHTEGTFNRFVSLLANLNYVYKDRYTVYASARRDGANVFGVNTNNKWKPLWSIGASWDIHKEQFVQFEWINYLKLRTSYGYSGNVNNNLSGLPTIYYSNFPDFLTNQTAASMSSAPNPDLRWEQTRIFNIGIDFGLLKNRISGSLDVFNKKSTDLISTVPFAPASGVSQFIVNAASLKGNGFEFQLISRNTTGVIKWETNFGLSYTKMIVSKLYEGGFRAGDFIAYNLNPAEGKIVYGVSSYKWEGLDPATGDPQGLLEGKVSKDYISIANDSIQNQKFHGSSVPLYNGYITNTLSWKNFTISARITYRLAFYFRKPTISYSSLYSQWTSNNDFEKRWQKPGDESHTTVPSMIYPPDSYRDNFYRGAEVNVFRGDNFRLQDIRLQYDLRDKLLKKASLKNAKIFVYADNLNIILWRKHKSNFDPDFSGGMEPTTAPFPRTWTAGFEIAF